MEKMMVIRTGKRFWVGMLIGLLVLSSGLGIPSLKPFHVWASELDPVQNSVISTDLFLNWIPSQKKELGLTSGQVRELKDIQVDFRLKSQDLGREMGRVAAILSKDVGTFPIPLKKVKPAIQRLSDLRGEVTYSAIRSLARVQGILKQQQWDKARRNWSILLRKQSAEKNKSTAR
ncbi:MAG: hypothetical protein ACYC9S_02650 [Leptospirales bacterium]